MDFVALTPFDHRLEMYQALGFSVDKAARLAEATCFTFLTDRNGKVKTYELPLHHLRVREMMKAGCSKADVLRIFT